MKLLLLKIDNRVEKIINFANSANRNGVDKVADFIIDCKRNNNEKVELLRLSDDSMIVNGKPQRVAIKWDSPVIKADDNYRMAVTVTDKTDENKPLEVEKNVFIGKTLEVCISYDGISKTINFYFADKVYDTVVDFGSESSQASWYDRGSDSNTQYVNFTKRIHNECVKNRTVSSVPQIEMNVESASGKTPSEKTEEEKIVGFSYSANTPLRNYVQYESDSLYRSIYYVKKENTQVDDECWPNYNSDFLVYLFEKSKLDTINNTHYRVPNSKIQMFNYLTEPVNVGGDQKDIWSAVMRRPLNNVICQTIGTMVDDARDNDFAIHLNLLMPNVYPTHLVSKKLKELAEDIELKRKNGNWGRLKAVELNVISESDASLVGYYNKRIDNLPPDGNYLVFDAGKGTLDFSVATLDRNRPQVFQSQSRSGIVGAGNAITYAVLVSLVSEFLRHKCIMKEDGEDVDFIDDKSRERVIRKFIYEKILENDQSDKKDTNGSEENHSGPDVKKINDLLDAVEEYKRFINEVDESSLTNNNVLSNLPNGEGVQIDYDNMGMEDFTGWVNEQIKAVNRYLIKDDIYIDAEIDNIVSMVKYYLVNMVCDKPEKDEKGKLKPMKMAGVVFTGRGCRMKRLCDKLKAMLRDIESIDIKEMIEYMPEESVDGTKDDLKRLCINLRQSLYDNKYDNGNDKLKIVKFYPQKQNVASVETSNKKDMANAKEERKVLDGDGFNGVPLGDRCDKVCIGGSVYSIANKDDLEIYYDGEKYFSFDGREEVPFDGNRYHEKDNKGLFFETLFPDVKAKNMDDVVIPTKLGDAMDVEIAYEETVDRNETRRESETELKPKIVFWKKILAGIMGIWRWILDHVKRADDEE